MSNPVIDRLASEFVMGSSVMSSLGNLRANLVITGVGPVQSYPMGREQDEYVTYSGELIILSEGGYSITFRFKDMTVTKMHLGSFGRIEVLGHDRSTGSFVSGVLVEMVRSDPTLKKFFFG